MIKKAAREIAGLAQQENNPPNGVGPPRKAISQPVRTGPGGIVKYGPQHKVESRSLPSVTKFPLSAPAPRDTPLCSGLGKGDVHTRQPDGDEGGGGSVGVVALEVPMEDTGETVDPLASMVPKTQYAV